jgi:hypothetical protein
MNPTPVQNPAPGLMVCGIQGVPVDRRASVEEAVMAGGSSLSSEHEAWVVPARKPPAYTVRIVGPRGFYREIRFAGRETPAEIEQSIRESIASS